MGNINSSTLIITHENVRFYRGGFTGEIQLELSKRIIRPGSTHHELMIW